MRILVWQWGRRGAGPRYAAELVRAFNQEQGATALLSLSEGAELMQTRAPPQCALPVPTYAGLWSFGLRLLSSPVLIPRLARWVRRERIDIALCAMPAAMDLVMAAALRLAGVRYVVIVHEADLHPGDRFALQIRLQRWLVRGARALFVLSAHVAERALVLGLVGARKLMLAALPPFHYGHDLPPPGAHGGKLRLLSFGRLLPYKGLDLLADGLARLGPRDDLDIRVVGSGPESPTLDRLRELPGVSVENRWVDEDEMASVLGWADALVLSHREASQSGVAAAAIAARRWVIATRVGGLPEQLGAEPTAILCDPDPASLAAAIATLVAMPRTPPEPDGAADAAWQRTAQRMLEGLREVAGAGRQPTRNQLPSPSPSPSPFGRGPG